MRSDTPRGSLSPTQAFLHRELEDTPRPSNRPLPILPLEIRHEICVKLDVENPQGNDWRRMAEKMGFNTDQRRWLDERFKSPTKKLLDDWETRNVSGGIVALHWLCDLYDEIKRPDVKELIEKLLSSGRQRDSGYGNSESQSTSCEATPNGSQATLNQSVASESGFETTNADVAINNMPVTDI
ncbi:myeloid differentiation primary response protein MyD88-B-like [Branchiostoma lanceolatum]|uniref:myeloid differentiation primary response protein MyD88-B-like n=1 Tax=Branchiostoma lanceolatum TaxID=7740 RepID=UPI003451C0A4